MKSRDDCALTELYLVRIWKRRSCDGEGTHSFHGKLQHVVSGASCYFDGLASLPEALGEMMGEMMGEVIASTALGAPIRESDEPGCDPEIP